MKLASASLFLQLWFLHLIQSEKIPNETQIKVQIKCPINRIDAITSVANESLLTLNGNNVWFVKNKRLNGFKPIAHNWPESDNYFHNNLNGLIVDEKDMISLLFKNNFFWISTHYSPEFRGVLKEIVDYFPEVTQIDASLLLVDKRDWCWNQFHCRTLHIFNGHFLWSFNWFHFWHIQSRGTQPINMKSINHNFPDSIDAAFAQNNDIFLIKRNIYFRIPINRFPFGVTDKDLRGLSLFDDIIRCEPYLTDKHRFDDIFAISSSINEQIFVNNSFSNKTLDRFLSNRNESNITNVSEIVLKPKSVVNSTSSSRERKDTNIRKEENNRKDIFAISSLINEQIEENLANNSSKASESFPIDIKDINVRKELENDVKPKSKVNSSTSSSTDEIFGNDSNESLDSSSRDLKDKNDSQTIPSLTTSTNIEENLELQNKVINTISSSTDKIFANNSFLNKTLERFLSNKNESNIRNMSENALKPKSVVYSTTSSIEKNDTNVRKEENNRKDDNKLRMNGKHESHRLMSSTFVWISSIVVIFVIIIIIAFILWKYYYQRLRGYYGLNND